MNECVREPVGGIAPTHEPGRDQPHSCLGTGARSSRDYRTTLCSQLCTLCSSLSHPVLREGSNEARHSAHTAPFQAAGYSLSRLNKPVSCCHVVSTVQTGDSSHTLSQCGCTSLNQNLRPKKTVFKVFSEFQKLNFFGMLDVKDLKRSKKS